MYNSIKLFALFLLFAICGSCKLKQSHPSPESIKSENKDKVTSPGSDEPDIYNKYEYTDANGKRVIIQNGYPRGGIKYTDPNGNVYSYAVFWTRIINETDHLLELKIDIPVTSYKISNFPGKYFKILAPADTITVDKVPLINQTDLASFLDHNIHKPSSVKRKIDPKKSGGFYFVMLISTLEATGMTRSGLSLKGQYLFYKISRYSTTKPVSLTDEKEIHCGSINLDLK